MRQASFQIDDPSQSRHVRVKLWLERSGYGSLTALAEAMGVHFSYPGKVLISCTEPIPADRLDWLLGEGFPEDLV